MGGSPDTSGYDSLGADINKVSDTQNQETTQGIISPLLPELVLPMADLEILTATKQFKADWGKFLPKLEKKTKATERYYLGNQYVDGVDPEQFDDLGYRPLIDNLIFESTETLVPLITRKNPDPVVEADNTPEGVKLANDTQKLLAYLADSLRLKLSLKQVVRMWSIYFLGCIKVGWDYNTKEVSIAVIRTPKLILDPRATIANGIYTGNRIGEYRDDAASTLIKRFPDKTQFITDFVKGELGTEIQYIEWWTPEYVCWELKDTLLGKAKNPHWNYEGQTTVTDELGNETAQVTPGKNHFPTPQMPYIFFSVFNMGKHPVDDTSLIYQNLPMQDVVNKRIRQIDRNTDQVNGGWVISTSKSGLVKEEASDFVEAMRSGGAAVVPDSATDEAVSRKQGLALPPQVYEQLIDARNEIRDSMGVRGSTPQGTISEGTVRGKILTAQQDGDRATFIAEYLEQFADQVFNWWVQLMYVYYDVPHTASVLGDQRTQEFVSLSQADFHTKLTVSVKEGSLIPKDPLTVRNEAIDLWNAKALDPITLFAALDFPNPRESAKALFLWENAPTMLFQGDPEIAQFTEQQQAAAQQAQGPGGVPPNPDLTRGGPGQAQSNDLLNAVPIQ